MENEENKNLNTTPPASQPIVRSEKSTFLSSKWLKIGIGAIIVLALLGGAYFLNLNQNSQTQKQEKTAVSTPSPTPTQTVKNFENTPGGYAFEIPNGWDAFQNNAAPKNSLFGPNASSKSGLGGVEVVKNNSLDSYLNIETAARFSEKIPTTIDGIDGVRQTYGGMLNGVRVVVFKGGYVYNIYMNSDKLADVEKFNQLISTFKFIDTKNEQSFLNIPEYGVKLALSENIKDAYYLPETKDKGYIYLKVHSLDSEPKCKSDPSSTAALSRVGKDEINEMSGQKYSAAGNGVTIGNYYYFIDLAQYECAESVNGKALLTNVRKEFSEASKTITSL